MLDWVYKPRASSDVFQPLVAPPSAGRLEWFRWLVSYSAYFALARGGLYALVDAADQQHVLAAAVTGPPGSIPYGRMSGGEMGDWCQKAGMAMAIEVLANNLRNRVLGTWQGQAHGDDGDRRHLELVIIATDPNVQRRGIGTTLLRFLGEVADADGVPTLLETAGARNTGFYAAKGGYKEVHRSPVANFNSEGGGVAMQRPPGGVVESIKGDGSAPHAPRVCSSASAPVLPAAGTLLAQEESGVACAFQPKRKSGPLASYCAKCGEHKANCR